VDLLAGVGLTDETKAWRRVVIEKPFGTNLETAQALQKSITKHLKETQIYRIDHYLGKSALQNILLTRFANLYLILFGRMSILITSKLLITKR
jgi:glucose-6-phosphate 1-dehydrogenase